MQRILFLSGILSVVLATAAPVTTFDVTFGGKEDDLAKAVAATNDGYLIAGKTNSFTKYRNYDAYVVKIDKAGNKLWERQYGGEDDESIDEMLPYRNGYLLFGSTETYGNERLSFYLSKIDAQGEPEWSNAFYTNEDDEYYGTALAVDGGSIVFGGTQRHLKFFSAEVEPLLLKVDKERDKLWRGYYGGEDEDFANAILTTDDGYIMAGTSESFGDDEFDGYVVKLDKTGRKLWYNTFGGDDDDVMHDIVETEDGYLIVGTTDSFGLDYNDVYVVKIDKGGKVLWEKAYGGEKDEEGYAIAKTNDGGYIITGLTESQHRRDGAQLYLFKIDANGKRLWSRAYGGESDDAGYDVIATEDGGYLVVGDKKSDRSRDSNMWVLKVNSKGRLK